MSIADKNNRDRGSLLALHAKRRSPLATARGIAAKQENPSHTWDDSGPRNLVKTIGDIGVGFVQGMARSFVATGAEISERIMNPMWKPQAKFGEASFTPKTDFQKALFGTSEPISFKSIGEEMLAIGTDDFAEHFGAFAIPLGLILGGLDVTPIGFGKSAAAKKAASAVAKTRNPARIYKAIKPLYSGASDDTLKAVSRAFVDVSNREEVYKTLSALGSVNIPKKSLGTRIPGFKPGADRASFWMEGVYKNIYKKAPDGISDLMSQRNKIKRLHTSGKITKKQFNLAENKIRNEITTIAKENNIKLKIDAKWNVRFADNRMNNHVHPDVLKFKAGNVTRSSFTDMTRFIEQADGAFRAAKRKLGHKVNGLRESMQYKVREMTSARNAWLKNSQLELDSVIRGLTKTQKEDAGKIMKYIGTADVDKPVSELLKNANIAKITKDPKAVKMATQSRKYYDKIITEQNYFRRLRGDKEIPLLEYYDQGVIKRRSLFSQIAGSDDVTRTGFDFIEPRGPFVKHAKKKMDLIPDAQREWDLGTLLEGYSNAAARDIFNKPIIDNITAHARAIEDVAPATAHALNRWASEAFAGGTASIDAALNLAPTVREGMAWWRHALVRGVFPLNFAWNSFVQTASAALTTTRYGVGDSLKGAADWFTNPKLREWAKQTYAYGIKTGEGGRITRQDISNQMTAAVNLNKSKLDNVTDMANFFTEAVEKHLTGWSALAARRTGKRMGLTGDDLRHFASDGAAKTQSMYNIEDIPAVLRNEVVRTAAPFQTYAFEGLNTFREFAGKTGVPLNTLNERMAWALRFTASAAAINVISQTAVGRKPWQAKSFVPFYDIFAAPIADKVLGDYSPSIGGAAPVDGIAPINITSELAEGLHDWLINGQKKKFRKAAIRYLPGFFGIPAGSQMSKTIDGMIAIADGGEKDPSGRMIFPITESKEQARALLAGPWATQAGQEKLHAGKKSILPEINLERRLSGVFPRKTDTERGEHYQRMSQPGYIRDYGQKVSNYAKAFVTDPENAFRAMFTKEELGEVTGNLVELQRFYGLDFRDKGGSQDYKKRLMFDLGLSWKDRDQYKLEHILPVKAGGGTEDDNLVLVDNDLHDFYTPIDIQTGWAVQSKKITRKEAKDLMIKFKVDETITAEDVLREIERLAAQKSGRNRRYQENWMRENVGKFEWLEGLNE